MSDYEEFLKKKKFNDVNSGFTVDLSLIGDYLKDFQSPVVRWALAKGRAAMFEDTGLGKTVQQLTWANHVVGHTVKPVLILTPLAVAYQTVEEAAKFGINAEYSRGEVNSIIVVSNYETLDHFNPSDFGGIVLDESSILKSKDGKTRKSIIDFAKSINYRLSCTATPSPNDFMELGTQAEFLGVMSQSEMLAMFFMHDSGDTSKWRLKKHAQKKFWEWMATWAVVIRKPSDIGFSDEGYNLPRLNMIEHVISHNSDEGQLFGGSSVSLVDQRRIKRDTMNLRCDMLADVVNATSHDWLIWCHLNDESDYLSKKIHDSIQVFGSQKTEIKEKYLLGFSHGEYSRLITKPSIAGFGMNWQHTNNQAWVGIDHSFEKLYQAIRRQYRFGQDKEVNCHLFLTESELPILQNLKRKQLQHEEMTSEMVGYMKDIMSEEIHGFKADKTEYNPTINMVIPSFIGDAK